MKYVRTKDGIYERMFPDCETQQISFDHKTIEPAYFTTDYEWVAQKDVIKQADTIEELCDEFVIFEEGSLTPFVFIPDYKKFKYDELQEYIGTMGDLVKHCLGAIWTNKGLIYVAKMNKEGELELL